MSTGHNIVSVSGRARGKGQGVSNQRFAQPTAKNFSNTNCNQLNEQEINE